jgi:chloramphenicol 3-O-phosphotransferase
MNLFKKLTLIATLLISASLIIATSYWFIQVKTDRPGIVVIINGTSSVGKTTVIKELKKSISDRYKLLGLDTFIATYNDEHPYKKELNAFASEQEKDLFMVKYWQTLLDNFFHVIKEEALSGKKILVDTVIDHDEITNLSKILNGISSINILIYCPLNVTLGRVKERNKSGIESEKRLSSLPIMQYMNIYKAQTESSEPVLDTIISKDIKQLIQIGFDRAILELPEDEKTNKEEISKKMKDDYKAFVQHFKLDDQEQVTVVSQDHYDLVVDCRSTSTEQAQTIIEFLETMK